MSPTTTSVEVFTDLVKSPHDKCQYRLITLPNKLQAILVSDEKLEKASASLDVHIGFFSDPDNIPGLAHFLEHLLFMGTEKYPRENEYSQYLSEHGGSSNAYTCEEHTNYFFDVTPDAFYGALDRFAQFFISPLFDPSGTDREMRAVDSENKKNLNNDHWRINQLEKHLSNPNHPYFKFGTGNLETLNVAGIRDTLIEFHSKYYSANLMKLVIYGNESLDQLQDWVIELFSDIRNANVPRPEWLGTPWDLAKLPEQQSVQVQTLKSMRTLSVSWLIPDQRANYLTKPEGYLTHLVGHEGEGSLFQALKRRGWLTSLSAGCDSDAHGYNFFQVSMELSPAGWDAHEEVLKALVQYIQLLRSWGPQERIFNEYRQLNEINFRFREKGEPSTFTHQLATWMHQYSHDKRLMLCGPFITEVYDSKCIQDLLNSLTCDRMQILRASSAALEDAEDIKTEPWYGTTYVSKPLTSENIESLRDIESGRVVLGPIAGELVLPEQNVFIPESFNVPISPAVPEPQRAAELISSSKNLNVWWKLDDTFEQPKSQVCIFFRSGLPSSSPLRSQRALLFKDLLKHCLVLYDATLAGLQYDFALLAEGFEVKVFGFSDKLEVLLERCLNALANLQFQRVDFDVVKDRQLRSLQNFPREAPYWHASHNLNGLISEPFHSIERRIAALKAMNDGEELEGLNSNYFQKEFVGQGAIEVLIHGSIEKQNAIGLVERLLKFDLNEPLSNWRQRVVKFTRPMEIVHLPPASTHLDNPNCAIEVYFPLGTLNGVRLRTLSALFVQVFNEPFFDTLRTVEQLGYIVTHGMREKSVLSGLRFMIQSERDPVYLDARIEAFLAENVTKTLQQMSASDFSTHCSALRLELTQRKKTLATESKSLWEAILAGCNDFLRPWIDAKQLDSVTLSDLKEFYELYLKKGGIHRTKVSVHIWSDRFEKSPVENAVGNHEKPTEHYGSETFKDVVLVEDRDEFVQAMELYPAIYIPETQ